jgi:LuxR family maltose regulon positive regulatory protein
VKVSFSIASAANDEAKECLVNSTKYIAEERLPIGRSFLRKKIVIPPLSEHYIHRTRLDPFVRKISLSRLSILLAPAGYGKTSLLNYWLKNEKVLFPHVAWLTIDSRDNDIFRLCYYLIESLSCVLDSDTKTGLYSLIDNSSSHWSESTSERLVIALVEKLELLDEPISIVLDNFQFIQSDQINNFFNSLLNHSPKNVSLIVLTCQATKLRLDRVLTEIGVTDLQFTEPESNELLDKILPCFVEPEVKAKLILRCEGWGAGLHLLSIALQCKDLQADVVLPESIDYLNEYFSNEVFDVLSEFEQKQLYRLGSIDYWCSDLCQHLLGDDIAEGWLQDIVYKLGFIEQLNDRGPWYRPHPMLRQALIDLGKISTESQSSIYTEASAWFDAQGMVSDAIEYTIKSGNTDGVLSLILKLSDVSLLDQSMATLLELRDKILQQGREKAGRLTIVY